MGKVLAEIRGESSISPANGGSCGSCGGWIGLEWGKGGRDYFVR